MRGWECEVRTVGNHFLGHNKWSRTPYNSEACILHEAYKFLGSLNYNRPYRKVKLWTDNKRLYNVLNKPNLSNLYMAQDSGAIIKRIVEINIRRQSQWVSHEMF